MSELFWLTDKQMQRIEPYFPLSHGVPRVDDRRLTVRPRRSTTGLSAGAGWASSAGYLPDWRPRADHRIS